MQLSPFLVSSTGDEGYRAANTLAGTRMNTSLFMTPSAVSVLTAEFLEDVGATRTEDFPRYSVSSDYDLGLDNNGNNNQWYDAWAKIRGFAGATVTRDYFSWALSSDIFNVERVDVNRGPNAVLYGIGATGGVLNTSSKTALLNSRERSASLTFGSWSKKRSELDIAVPLLAEINRASGQEQMQHQKESMNVFTSYRFRDASFPFLHGMRVGGGANYRTSPVIGYDPASNNAPIRGISNLLTNLMVGKIFRPGRNETFDVQLNLQNVLAEHDMIPLQARGPGQFIVFNYPRVHRNWDLKASYRF